LMNDLLPCSAFQSLFFQREVISKYGALVWWWRLIVYMDRRWKDWIWDIKEFIPEVLDEKWEVKISEEDWKLIMDTPQANYTYMIEQKKK
jgi:hypothetical protein